MDVILLERIESLGQMGDVVKVKPGYARNFLLPQKKALRATKENREYFDKQRAQLEAQNLQRRSDAQAVSSKMENLSVIIIRQAGEFGQLYGSVTTRDIAAAITAAGFTVNRQQVHLDQPIKTLGLHKARVALHPEVSISATVNVALTEEEAAMQAAGKVIRRGGDGEETAAAAETAAPAEAAPAEAAPAPATDAKEEAEPKKKKAKAKKAAE
ncbi:MAG: 50S ribosomal protein L9 [Alphaproteobacteria bacterium]|nr:50S ribosomal protein L9 [Alphaproteobacteria bacterium]